MTSKYDNSSEMCFQKELALSVPFEMVDEESIYVWQNAGMSGKQCPMMSELVQDMKSMQGMKSMYGFGFPRVYDNK